MKVLILYESNQSLQEKSLEDILTELEIPFIRYPFCGPEKSVSLDNLYSQLEESSHICCMIPENREKGWFLFSAAYCLGKGKELFLFLPDEADPPPTFFKRVPLSSSLEVFTGYYDLEKTTWGKEAIRRRVEKELRERGIPFNKEGLALTVSEGDKYSLELFLKTDISLNFKNSKGIPLLSLAVRNNHRALIPLLLAKDVDLNCLSEDRNNTPLMDAAAGGNREILEDLLRAGAELNIQSKNGQTALILAIGGGYVSCAELLIRAGADISIKDKVGMDALMYAKLFNQKAILEMLEHARSSQEKQNT